MSQCASSKTTIAPSGFSGSGYITDYGLHFDDGSIAAYDYSGGTGEGWLRGTVVDAMPYVSRYLYWDQASCNLSGRVRARLQFYDPYTGMWYDTYDKDVDILHLTNRPSGSQVTQAFANLGDWFYKVVGTESTCGTAQAHSHLGMTLSSTVANTVKANDTCWANGTECNVMGGISVKKHSGSSCPPYSWSGQYAINRSGTVVQPYLCQTWSNQSRSVDDPTFAVYW